MVPVPDPVYIRDEIARLAEILSEAGNDSRDAESAEPLRLTDALSDVLDALQRRERSQNEHDADAGIMTSEPSLGDLGDHAVSLLSQLSRMARRMHLEDEADALEALMLPLACCVARAGGELTQIAPVVNAAAALASRFREPEEVTGLFRMTDDVFHGVSPRVSDAPPGSEDARAWRVLIINRAIMATRTHKPAFMEDAFDTLVEYAFDDAAAFFREGMEQM
ncbi:MAG: hypothetical protein WBG92_00910, partial [Thiohalocapsa sp.]